MAEPNAPVSWAMNLHDIRLRCDLALVDRPYRPIVHADDLRWLFETIDKLLKDDAHAPN